MDKVPAWRLDAAAIEITMNPSSAAPIATPAATLNKRACILDCVISGILDASYERYACSAVVFNRVFSGCA